MPKPRLEKLSKNWRSGFLPANRLWSKIDTKRKLSAQSDIKNQRFFDIAQKRHKTLNQSTLVGSRAHFGPIFIDFGSPFWLHFSFFFPKTRKLIFSNKYQAKLVFWHVFLSQNLSLFGPFFIDFSCFFQDKTRRPFLEGPGADLASTIYKYISSIVANVEIRKRMISVGWRWS